jgi:NifB/MoaA-like Fe-S oxidoreductase
MNNPKPTPSEEEPVANFENSFGMISEDIPHPVSFTATTTSPLAISSCVVTEIVPLFVNFRALLSRFEIT